MFEAEFCESVAEVRRNKRREAVHVTKDGLCQPIVSLFQVVEVGSSGGNLRWVRAILLVFIITRHVREHLTLLTRHVGIECAIRLVVFSAGSSVLL